MSLTDRALAISPNGRQTLSKNAAPLHVVRGDGSRLWTADGAELIDWVCSLATVTLGHAHPHVNAAVTRQLRDGGTFALPHALEVAVSERLCATMGYEQVRWSTTGSEATEGAVRIARIATGRDLIATNSYHSWYSTFSAARPEHPGCPEEFRHVMKEWNTLDELEHLLARWQSVAAIILEPMKFDGPTLHQIVALGRRYQALVIFDEVVSGLRVAMRGAQELHNVRPDLSVYGKALTNGTFPVSAIVGPRYLMEHAWPVSGTYSGHPVGLAAVNAVLDVYEREPIIERIHAAGAAFIEDFNAMGSGLRANGHPARPILTGDAELMRRFHAEIVRHGVLLHPNGNNAMAAHTSEDVAATLSLCAAALRVCA